MFILKCGDRDNSNAISLIDNNSALVNVAESFSLIELQKYLDGNSKDMSVGQTDLIEVAITIADEIFGAKMSEDIANNMWFQWCVNRYNKNGYHISSFQMAENLFRKTYNDYRKVLNSLSDEVHMTSFEVPSQLFQLIEGIHLYIKLPTRAINIDGKNYYLLDFDSHAQIEISSGVKNSGRYTNDVPLKLILPNIKSTISPTDNIMSFAKKDPVHFQRSIDFSDQSVRDKILDEAWEISRSLDVYGVEVAQQWEPTVMLLEFLTEEDAQEALSLNNFREINIGNRDQTNICFTTNEPFIVQWKGDRLIPRYRKS